MNEAELLARLRALPLHPGARGLADDAAVLGRYVVTTDTLVEGVHFLADDPPADVAWKLVATNLSDLAAKGARVEGVLLNLPLSDVAWDTAFLDGIAAVLARFDCPLIGGDTVSLPRHAPRVLTCTAVGADTPAPARGGAQAGDALFVTGTIGDAGAGLALLQAGEDEPALVAAYRRPQPRLSEGRTLAPMVHAMMDVSDGLLIDAARMAAASGLAAEIALDAVPLSAAFRRVRGEARDACLFAATAGDDYQLLFAAAADVSPPAPATRVGILRPGAGLSLTYDGEAIFLPHRLGFEHGLR